MDSNRIKQWISKHTGKSSKVKWFRKDRLLIMLLSGILLLVITFPVPDGKNEEDQNTASETGISPGDLSDTEEYASYMEKRLREILSKVSGVGEVEVMVTLHSTSEKVVEKDEDTENESVTEQDSQGGTRSTVRNSASTETVYGEPEGDTSSGQEPYITKELSPAVEGVVVIAQGGDQPVTVKNITEAVQALFNVDTHKIKVMKLNDK